MLPQRNILRMDSVVYPIAGRRSGKLYREKTGTASLSYLILTCKVSRVYNKNFS